MLGNFSIGDYFKKEAIKYAWELLTSQDYFGFEKSRLYATVYPSDQEAYDLWVSVGMDSTHIVKLEANFWEIGEGPSGPNTEIFYDRGEKYNFDTPKTELYPGGENERYLILPIKLNEDLEKFGTLSFHNIMLRMVLAVKNIQNYLVRILIQAWD